VNTKRIIRGFFRLLYNYGLMRPYRSIDRLHYLKRLSKEKHPYDEWYYSDKDVSQFGDGEVLICTAFRDKPVMFICKPQSKVERQIINNGLYSPHILSFMVSFLSQGSIILDVGANIGAYTVPLAKAFPEIEVHAFEPNPYAIAHLRRNITLNRLSNIRLYEMGLGDEPCVLELNAFDSKDLGSSSFISPQRAGSKSEPIPVQVEKLDNIYAKDTREISLIKIDVQGFEFKVLKGACELISRNRPYILLEHEDVNFSTTEEALAAKRNLQQFFSEYHYRLFYMTRYDRSMLFPVSWERPLNGDLLAIPESAQIKEV
jgi:FkbM family methyltransferase